MRWNNIGLVGGKGLLNALKKNHSLMQLQIAGNNIPDEIADAISTWFLTLFSFFFYEINFLKIKIDLKLSHNIEQVKSVKEYNKRTSTLTNELQSVQFEKDKQVNLLLNKIDLQEEAMRKTNRTMSEKMKKLQGALEDRMSTMNAMTSKLSIVEADLALSEQKCADLEHALQKLQLDKDNEIKLLNAKSKRDREVKLNRSFTFCCIFKLKGFSFRNWLMKSLN